jgi:hypothetical protein
MSSRQLAPPRLPDPPQEITQIYMDDLIRAIQTFIENETNPGESRATKIVLTEMPTSDTGIEAGTLYRIGNDVKISLLDIAVPDSLFGTGSVGSVTVVTA